MNNEIKILNAMPEDARGITNVLHKTWLATYPNEEYGIAREAIEESYKDSFTEESLNKLGNKIANLPANEKRFVAKEGDNIVGVATVVRNADNNQLRTIYVLPECQGKGIGKMLWQEAKKFCDPTKDTIVQAVTYNKDAIGFYKKLGFEDTGKRFESEIFRIREMCLNIPELEMVIKAKKL